MRSSTTLPQTPGGRRHMVDSASTGSLVAEVTSGNVRAGARLISRIEHSDESVLPVLRSLYRVGGRSRIVGVTGPPGAGKSTLIDKLIGHWRRSGLRVAVLAVDPSSPFSGGALLGDRLRMGSHSGDDGVFIRSMASRGRTGGLAAAARDALVVLDAMPWDVVLLETVGVGQNETEVMRYASVVVLVQTPMGGDDVQAAKAGIMEIGDVLVVNKADHADADRAARMLRDVVARTRRLHPDRVWVPPVLKSQAFRNQGVVELAEQIDRFFEVLKANPEVAESRQRERARHRVGQILRELLDRHLNSGGGDWLDEMSEPLLSRTVDPYAVAEQLLSRVVA